MYLKQNLRENIKHTLEEAGQFERYLLLAGIKKESSRYFCPICNSKTASALLTTKKDKIKYYCYSCGGRALDLLDFIQQVNNCNYIEALKVGADFLGNKQIQSIEIRPAPTQQEQEQKQARQLYAIRRDKKPLNDVTKHYLNKRGLLGVAERINQLEALHLNIYTSSSNYNGITTNYITYDFLKPKQENNKGFLIRKNIDTNCKKSDKVRNTGKAQVTLLATYKHNKYVVVEGIEDGLSALLLEFNVICLNGTSNAPQLIERLKNSISWSSKQEFILLLDTDGAGDSCRNELIKQFKNYNIPYTVPNKAIKHLKNKGIKDINDYLKAFKNDFKQLKRLIIEE